jgi:hypothetical protein
MASPKFEDMLPELKIKYGEFLRKMVDARHHYHITEIECGSFCIEMFYPDTRFGKDMMLNPIQHRHKYWVVGQIGTECGLRWDEKSPTRFELRKK